MAWIDVIDESGASGELEEAYRSITGARGKLSNIMRVHSLHPGAMLAHMELYRQLLFSRSGLSRAERELIGVVVSARNACSYCVRHHAEALRAYWKDADRVQMAIDNYDAAGLTARQRAMLDYAVRLTDDPSAVSEGHVEQLREADLSDRDILDVNLIASYFNFVNRIAEGLGVTFTDDEATGFRY
ncbi:MAG: peroxidase-related enzyme [Rhodothermales bacterium]